MMTEHQRLVEGNEHARRIGDCKSDFEVLEKLGRGAHGVAFKVKSRKNGQTYVMKIVDFSSKSDAEGQFKYNAIREVQVLKLLKDHPHVIKYYNSFMEDQSLHIVMEYAERGDLSRLVRKAKETATPISEEVIWLIAFQICLGVGYLHSLKTVH